LDSGKVEKEEVDRALQNTKSRMKMFISYQLTNKLVSSGVGCGYYDDEGNNDNHGIWIRMNDYLFNVCFLVEGGVRNIECFVDYLLLNFSNTFADNDDRYIPTEIEFTKILDKERLAAYWVKNRDLIRGFKLTEKEKTISNGNYSATYRKDLSRVYAVLEEIADSVAAGLQKSDPKLERVAHGQ